MADSVICEHIHLSNGVDDNTRRYAKKPLEISKVVTFDRRTHVTTNLITRYLHKIEKNFAQEFYAKQLNV